MSSQLHEVLEPEVIETFARPEPARAEEVARGEAALRARRVAQLTDELRQRLRDSLAPEPPPPFALDPEFMRLFHAIDSTRAEPVPYVVQFVASEPGEGCSTMASGFAVAAALEYRAPVLLLDCGIGAGPSVLAALAETGAVEPALEAAPGVHHLWRARLGSAPDRPPSIDARDLRTVLGALRSRFRVVVLDCPAASVASESLALSRHCDGTVLVVRAESVRRETAVRVRDAIERFGGMLIGAVVNRQQDHLPAWLRQQL